MSSYAKSILLCYLCFTKRLRYDSKEKTQYKGKHIESKKNIIKNAEDN